MTTSSSTSTLPPTTPTTTATTTKSSSSTNNSVPHPTHPTSSHGPEDHPRHSMSLKNVRTSLALDAINAPDRTYMYRTNRSSEVDVLYQRLSQVQTEKIETQYTLQFQHEVLVRPEETSPQTCLLEIVKQVHVFLQFREEIVLVLQTGKWLPYEFNSHPDMCFGTLEQVAERLVRLWNEFLFTTRPLTQSRAMYVKPSVTQEQPFSIFGLFSKLEDLTEHQAMLLVKRSSMNLDEWVGLRNVLVLLNERAKCSKEMKF
ncbi:hypothetical protein HMI54_011388 [Coelomomyces lativittatus]|nr:hypothetical protein HMI54_011388 [Coelomomyces lativittatus]